MLKRRVPHVGVLCTPLILRNNETPDVRGVHAGHCTDAQDFMSVFMSTRVGAADVVERCLNQFGVMGAAPA